MRPPFAAGPVTGVVGVVWTIPVDDVVAVEWARVTGPCRARLGLGCCFLASDVRS